MEVKEKSLSPPAEKEKPPTQLSPRSISDRLKQPKLQQKMNEAHAKSLSPEPPVSPVQPASLFVNNQNDERDRVNFRLGKI